VSVTVIVDAGPLVAFLVKRDRRLLSRYRDVPMSVADVCLVRLAELCGNSPVLTLDQDFAVYRKHGRQVIPLISPG